MEDVTGYRRDTEGVHPPLAFPAYASSVLDGAGDPLPDALVEIWQAYPSGRYAAEGLRGFAGCPTDADGRYAILTMKSAPVPGPDGTTQAPHLALSVFARGLLDRVGTRVYFPDEDRGERGRSGPRMPLRRVRAGNPHSRRQRGWLRRLRYSTTGRG